MHASRAAPHSQCHHHALALQHGSDGIRLDDVISGGGNETTACDGQPLQPVIFFDINGVLHISGRTASREWDAACVSAFRHLINATNARLVLSSSWRVRALSHVHALLAKHSLPPLVGVTPVLGKEHAARGDEILQWLSTNRYTERVGAWAVLDDGALHVTARFGASVSLANVTVPTKSTTGLTHAMAEDAAVRLACQHHLLETRRRAECAAASFAARSQRKKGNAAADRQARLL